MFVSNFQSFRSNGEARSLGQQAKPRRELSKRTHPTRRRAMSVALVAGGMIVLMMGQLAVAAPVVKKWKPKFKKNQGSIKVDYWWTNEKGERCNADGSIPQGSSVPKAGQVILHGGDNTKEIPLPAAVDDVATSTNMVENSYVSVNSEALKHDESGAWVTDLPGILDQYSLDEIDWPSFFHSTDTEDLHVSVDVNQFYLAGAPQFDADHAFSIANGLCSELPGYLFSYSQITIDPQMGFVTASPFSGDGVTSWGTEGAAVPEPSMGLGVLLGATVRLLRRPHLRTG
jgi:hypothetical protein